MSYGKMNDFADLVLLTKEKDAESFVSEQETVLASVRIYREGRHGSERWANLAAFSEATDLFRFRVIPGVKVTTEQFLVCDGERFNIVSVEDVKGRGMYLEVLAKKVEATLFADDGAAEVVKEFKSGKLSLGVDDIGASVAAELTGVQIDDNRVVISSSEDGGNPVAVGFRAKKSNGKYRYYWLYRVKFGIPATNLATKGDSITFSTPTIEGTVLRRNKPDGRNNHPWKAEVTEGDADVPTSVITDWFTNVYEPTFSI